MKNVFNFTFLMKHLKAASDEQQTLDHDPLSSLHFNTNTFVLDDCLIKKGFQSLTSQQNYNQVTTCGKNAEEVAFEWCLSSCTHRKSPDFLLITSTYPKRKTNLPTLL